MKEITKMKDKFNSHPLWYSAEGWAVDRDSTPYRVGYEAYNWWWYEELGFRAYRVYCDKEVIERNFRPITPLQEIKRAGV